MMRKFLSTKIIENNRGVNAVKYGTKITEQSISCGKSYWSHGMPETSLIKQWGGELRLIPLIQGVSTTITAERIRKL